MKPSTTVEDTVELQCLSDDHVLLRTRLGAATLAQLVRSTLRLRPDRIVVGEVRGAEALDLLKAWGIGHPGGIATIHAGSAHGALVRLEQLVQEVVVAVSRALIAEAVDVIVYLESRGTVRHRAAGAGGHARGTRTAMATVSNRHDLGREGAAGAAGNPDKTGHGHDSTTVRLRRRKQTLECGFSLYIRSLSAFDDGNSRMSATTTSLVSVEFPVKSDGTRTAAFEVSGLDRSKLPGWD